MAAANASLGDLRTWTHHVHYFLRPLCTVTPLHICLRCVPLYQVFWQNPCTALLWSAGYLTRCSHCPILLIIIIFGKQYKLLNIFYSDSPCCATLYWIQMKYYGETQQFNTCHPMLCASVQRKHHFHDFTKIKKKKNTSTLAVFIMVRELASTEIFIKIYRVFVALYKIKSLFL